MRLIAGKVLMDRNAPAALPDTAQLGYDESKALIAQMARPRPRLYAITPRFAGTSTPAQLEPRARCGASTRMCWCTPTSRRTVARSRGSRELFPERRDYLDIYDSSRPDRPARRAGARRPSRRDESAAAMRAARRSRIARPRTCFSAAGLFRSAPRATRAGRCRSALAPTSAAAPASRCSPRWARPTRSRSSAAARSTRSRRSIWRRSAARARSRSMTASARSRPARRPTSWCSTRATPLLALRNAAPIDRGDCSRLMMLGDDRAVRATYVAGELAHASPSVDPSAPPAHGRPP